MVDVDSPSREGCVFKEDTIGKPENGLKSDSHVAPNNKPVPQSQASIGNTPESKPATDQDETKEETECLSVRDIIERKRKQMGLPPLPRVPDRSAELEEGDVMLYSEITRHVILKANKHVVKYGNDMTLAEVPTLQFAKDAGIPVPKVFSSGTPEDRRAQSYIEMTYIEGDTLKALWDTFDQATLVDLAHQLRDILKIMRTLPAPPDFIGGFNLNELRDFRHNDIFVRPACHDEEGFNQYLTEESQIPACIKQGFLKGIGTSHKIVFSHCDLAPRNIMVREGRIVTIIDWEAAGWYPEYWEYIKFLHVASRLRDWAKFIDEVFTERYDEEAMLYTGLLWFQNSFDHTKSVVVKKSL